MAATESIERAAYGRFDFGRADFDGTINFDGTHVCRAIADEPEQLNRRVNHRWKERSQKYLVPPSVWP